MGYATTPTFVDYEIGYHLEPTGISVNAPIANTEYQGNSVTLTKGVWLVKGRCGIYSSINNSRVYVSLSTNNLGHDTGNRTFCHNNPVGIGTNAVEVNKVFVVPTAGQTIYIMVSSNTGTAINPTYYVSYEVTRLA